MSDDDNTAMYSQCPKCQTVFRVTMTQLQARDGLVRCGQCSNTFQADQHLYADMPAAAPKKKKEPAAVTKKAAKTKAKTTPAAKPAAPAAAAESDVIEVAAAPAPWTPPDTEKPKAAPADKTQTPNEQKPRASEENKSAKPASKRRREKATHTSTTPMFDVYPPPRVLSAWWIVGSMLLLIVLAAQAAYFYRDALAMYPELRPLILEACEHIGCTLQPHSDVARIELIEPTGISPHPRAANALRVRATLVNRSKREQPYPLMQVTLTDNTGHVLSRRLFAPRDYLEQPSVAQSEMPTNLAVNASLDVTNPDGKAIGYQIDFIAPPVQ